MPGDSRADRNRRVTRELLKEKLQGYGLIDQALKNIEKLEDFTTEMDSVEVQRLKSANDTRIKLLDKILPSEKLMELVGDEERPLKAKWEVEIVHTNAKTPATK